jgi:hypothetical protein
VNPIKCAHSNNGAVYMPKIKYVSINFQQLKA